MVGSSFWGNEGRVGSRGVLLNVVGGGGEQFCLFVFQAINLMLGRRVVLVMFFVWWMGCVSCQVMGPQKFHHPAGSQVQDVLYKVLRVPVFSTNISSTTGEVVLLTASLQRDHLHHQPTVRTIYSLFQFPPV